jgi:hypothetical protein
MEDLKFDFSGLVTVKSTIKLNMWHRVVWYSINLQNISKATVAFCPEDGGSRSYETLINIY